jgi:hypothetical protein
METVTLRGPLDTSCRSISSSANETLREIPVVSYLSVSPASEPRHRLSGDGELSLIAKYRLSEQQKNNLKRLAGRSVGDEFVHLIGESLVVHLHVQSTPPREDVECGSVYVEQRLSVGYVWLGVVDPLIEESL